MFEQKTYDKFYTNYGSSHQIVLSVIEPNSKVLDIGCSTGRIGKELKKRKCLVVGIDKNKDAIKEASKTYNKVIILDLDDNSELKLEQGYFDILLFGDVLEHTKYPDKVLKNLLKYLKPKGKIILIIPNIANWKIRRDILLGKWNYTETGIIEKGHLRFFDMKSINLLLNEAKLNNIRIYGTYSIKKLGFFKNVRLLQKIVFYAVNLKKSFLAYQFAIIATKK
jgi:2-polyprenyl-3-methyl-5-hydroxy-6-metoxy-1,4-benzoquinol methylase